MTHRRLIAALAVSLLPLAAAASAPAASAHRGAQVRILGTNTAFSPNGDGVQDRAEIRYRLTRPATVTVLVRRAGRTVATLPRGHQGKGRHTVTWNGKRHGKPVADGRYRVLVRTTGTRTTTAHTTLTVDTKADVVGDGTVAISSDTVYPRTTLIHDVVVGDLIPDYDALNVHWFPSSGGPTPEEVALGSVRSQVVDPTGHVVDSAPVETATTPVTMAMQDDCTSACARFTWDGRDSTGEPAAVGRYLIRVVQGHDRAGNPRLLAEPVRVRISTTKLVRRTTTVTQTPAQATPVDYEDVTCNDCSAHECSSVPSTRFPGGLSYRSVPDQFGHCVAHDEFTVPSAGRRTPYDTFRVTAAGGPTTPGSVDTATLVVYAGASIRSYPLGTADGTDATVGSVRVPIAANTEPFGQAMFSTPVMWAVFVGDGNSYDIASFTIEQTTYVPAS